MRGRSSGMAGIVGRAAGSVFIFIFIFSDDFTFVLSQFIQFSAPNPSVGVVSQNYRETPSQPINLKIFDIVHCSFK